MGDYVLSCCSTVDLPPDYLGSRDISYICFHYYMDGTEYVDDLGKSMSFPDFYARMREGAETKTSQVNVEEFTEYFRGILEQGKDILHVCLSSGLSGVMNSASAARDLLLEEYPGRQIFLVDSLGASSGYGLLMDKLADMRDMGKDAEEVYRWAQENKLKLHHWFFSTDLTFYVKGGRISKVSGWFGTALDICPLLNMDDRGYLIPRFKIRGKKKVIKEIVSKMEQYAQGRIDYSGKCFLSHSDCYEDALRVASLIEERFPKMQGKVMINNVGTTIGSHTGPGTVALFFWGDERVR